MTAAQTPRPAATLALIRQGSAGPEVLMLQRTHSAAFLGGAYVFPGGSLDPQDSDARIASRALGITDAEASERLGLPSGGLAYYLAAIRECFEEAGVLLARDEGGAILSADRAAALMDRRQQPFIDLLEAENLFLPAASLAYCGHWITAPGRARRFDTRFFVALAPDGQAGAHDAAETVHDLWIRPQEALERGDRGEIELVFATRHTLKDLSRFPDRHAAFA